MRIFCEVGTPGNWIETEDRCIPLSYDVDGTRVLYYPHWNFIQIGYFFLPLPTTRDDLLRYVRLGKLILEVERLNHELDQKVH